MELSFWLSVLCLVTARITFSKTEDRIVVSKARPECNLTLVIFCDFSTIQTENVYLEQLKDADINKVFVQNAKHLHVEEAYCTDLALQKVTKVTFEGEMNQVCPSGYELAAKQSHLEGISGGVNNVYLKGSSINSLSTSTPLTKLAVYNSTISVLALSSPFSKGTSLTIQGSNIETLKKLIIEEGAEVTLQSNKIQRIDPHGFVAKNGSLTINDTVFGYVTNDGIKIHKAVKLTQANNNIDVTNYVTEGEKESNTLAIIVGSVVVIVLLVTVGVAVTCVMRRKGFLNKNRNPEAIEKGKADAVDTTGESSKPFLASGEASKTNVNGDNAELIDTNTNAKTASKSKPTKESSKPPMASGEASNIKENENHKESTNANTKIVCRSLTPGIIHDIITKLKEIERNRITSVEYVNDKVKVLIIDTKGKEQTKWITNECSLIDLLFSSKIHIPLQTEAELRGKMTEPMYKYIELKRMYDFLLEVQTLNTDIKSVDLLSDHVKLSSVNGKIFVMKTKKELRKFITDGNYKTPPNSDDVLND